MSEDRPAASTPDKATEVPVARVHRPRRAHWVWLIPLLAVVFVITLFIMYGLARGPVITITFASGDGIKPGDVLRCRGIIVGEVEDVQLADDLDGVRVRLRLDAQAKQIARAGSRFWVVRPQVGPGGVAGLETIAGPRYLAVSPGDGDRQTRFVGLDEPPVVERVDPAGLEITLMADKRHGLRPGAAVLYRGVVIGRVLSVGLASDATTVEARLYIEPIYASLVRSESRFWNVGGAAMDLGLSGLSVEIESLMTLLDGGVAMATPESPGDAVSTGHRFTLHAEAESEWLEWRPALAVGTELLPAGVQAPQMQRVTVSRREGLLRLTRQHKGWLLPMADGLVGPAALLSREGEAEIEVAGERVSLEEAELQSGPTLATLDWQPEGVRTWPAERVRAMEEAEDCVVIAGSTEPPRPIAAGHLEATEDGRWQVSPMLSLPDDLSGAAVLSREDGMLLGLLLVERGQGAIAPLEAAE